MYKSFCMDIHFQFSLVHDRSDIAGHMIILMFNFLRNCLFSKAASPFFIPTSNIGRFQCLSIFTQTSYCLSFYYSPPSWCEVFLVDRICTSLMTYDVRHYFMCFWHSLCLLWGNTNLNLCLFLNFFWVVRVTYSGY